MFNLKGDNFFVFLFCCWSLFSFSENKWKHSDLKHHAHVLFMFGLDGVLYNQDMCALFCFWVSQCLVHALKWFLHRKQGREMSINTTVKFLLISERLQPTAHLLKKKKRKRECHMFFILNGSGWQSSEAVWKSRWPSWAFCPIEPYGFCGRKATVNHA